MPRAGGAGRREERMYVTTGIDFNYGEELGKLHTVKASY